MTSMATREASKTIPPVFVKVSDILTRIGDYDFSMAVATQVGHDKVLGCQKIRGLWRLYLMDQEVRVKLITQQLTVNN